ncbi:MAG TPA: GAF domain-containing protein, partial [Anaerolineales bacterium]|nr:GAF domain-containing protein [Anaerolineales bacterium]
RLMVAPLLTGELVSGMMAVWREGGEPFAHADLSFLQELSLQAAIAIKNANLFDETQQRAAELAIINSVQEGLASKFEMQAIYELVGDKLSEITGSEIVMIQTWDVENGIRRDEYSLEKGKRFPTSEHAFTQLEHLMIANLQAGKPIVWNEGMEDRIKKFGHSHIVVGELPLSVVVVPLKTGKAEQKAITAISLQNGSRQHAFSDSDVRLLETLASSMSVALENARLFDETQRLLKETEQRATELVILNNVSGAMTSTLDVKTLTYNVGDKLRDIFNTEIVDILMYDSNSGIVNLTYSYFERYFEDEPPWELGGGLTSKIILSQRPLLLNTAQEILENGAESYVTAPDDSEDIQSYLGVPIMVGDKVLGVIDVQSFKSHAFNENNLRLLQTLSSNMGVALENARLFNESQLLLRETKQRNAELATVNSVQHALAAQLDLQKLYELIGEKVRAIFDAQIATIVTYDLATGLLHHQYYARQGNRLRIDPVPLTDIALHLIRNKQPLLINADWMNELAALGIQPRIIGGDQLPKATLFAPLMTG